MVTNGKYGDALWLLRGCTVVTKMLLGGAPLLLRGFKEVCHGYYKGVHGGAPCFTSGVGRCARVIKRV